MKRLALVAGLLALAAAGVLSWRLLSPRRTPAGQPPLTDLRRDDLAELKQAFNAASDRPRILMMLSPT